MNYFDQWMQSEWLRALGWTFVHSLWQIALAGLLLFIVLRLIPGRSARVRYTIAAMTLWLVVILSLSTFIIMLPDIQQIRTVAGQVVLIKSAEPLTISERISLWLESRMPMMLTVWFGGVIILLLRLALSLGWISHMRSSAIHSDDLQESFNGIVRRLSIKVKAIASESPYISSPVTIGHLKPMILFPIGIVNQLTPAEVEAVLTHELAHILRKDYLSNLIQSVIETLFYYHPVIWWISNIVRTERENRADDLAVSWCGDHLSYAKALMTVQEMQTEKKPALAIGFASRKGAMLARIQRILHIPYKNHNQMEKTVLLSLCSLCFLAFTLTGEAKNENQKETGSLMKEVTSVVERTRDTIPSKGTYRIHKKTDDQDINIEVEDGDIRELKIDGKDIAPDDFDQYDAIIDGLFGEIEAPPSMEGFHFEMPAMPPMPHMPEMMVLPRTPPMPPMPEMELKHFFGDGNIAIWDGNEHGRFKLFTDSTDGEHRKIIIIGDDGDSTIILKDGFIHGYAPMLELEKHMFKAEDWEKMEKDWKLQAEEWQQHAEEWKKHWEENSGQWQKEWQLHHEKMKDHKEEMKDLKRELERDGSAYKRLYELRELEGAREAEDLARGRVYGIRAPRMNMTEAMTAEGLIQPGEEAEIVLTPDKLKINGKKMDDETHRKYLRMYEAQQGVELSGNSRVEFKTKTRRSM